MKASMTPWSTQAAGAEAKLCRISWNPFLNRHSVPRGAIS
jgi:hypothetical protein